MFRWELQRDKINATRRRRVSLASPVLRRCGCVTSLLLDRVLILQRFKVTFSMWHVTVGCVPEAAVYGPPSVQQTLGGLPVVASFLDQLGVAAISDGLCPIRDVALATHGQVIEAMIAIRLTSPRALVRVIDWAREWAVEHLLRDRSGGPQRRPARPRPGRYRPGAGPDRRHRRDSSDPAIRPGRFPGPPGHDLDLPLRRLPRGGSGGRHAEIRSPKGSPPGSEADPDRDRDQRRRRHPDLPPGLRRWRRRGVAGVRCDDSAAGDRR